MKIARLLTTLSAVSLAATAQIARADIITYTVTGTGASGSFNGVSFTNQSFTITAIGDTSTLATRLFNGPSFLSVQLSSLVYQIGTNPAATATTPSDYYFGNFNLAAPNLIGITNLSTSSYTVWTASGAASWSPDTSFPATAAGYSNGTSISTDQGGVVMSGWTAATFSATTSAAAPEPGSLALLALGVVGLVARKRRR